VPVGPICSEGESHGHQRSGGPGHRTKISPESVAQQTFDAVESGQIEVLADPRTREVKASLPRDHELLCLPLEQFWDAAVAARG